MFVSLSFKSTFNLGEYSLTFLAMLEVSKRILIGLLRFLPSVTSFGVVVFFPNRKTSI